MNFDNTQIESNLLNTRIVYDDNNKYYEKYDTVILSCYMTSKKDPQRDLFQDNNNYEYIKPWYESVKKHDLHGIIFYDQLSDEFVEQYKTEKIIFIKTKIGKFSINDERFILYYKYLLLNKYKYVLMTDVSDVCVNKNPFDVINDDKIFVGTNVVGKGPLLKTSEWITRRKWKLDPFNELLNSSGYDPIGFHPDEKQIYSAGLLGGSYQKIIWFLEQMINVMLLIDSKKNYNMIVFNYVIFRYLLDEYNSETYCTKYIHTGSPFNSMFGRHEIEGQSENCLLHK